MTLTGIVNAWVRRLMTFATAQNVSVLWRQCGDLRSFEAIRRFLCQGIQMNSIRLERKIGMCKGETQQLRLLSRPESREWRSQEPSCGCTAHVDPEQPAAQEPEP